MAKDDRCFSCRDFYGGCPGAEDSEDDALTCWEAVTKCRHGIAVDYADCPACIAELETI